MQHIKVIVLCSLGLSAYAGGGCATGFEPTGEEPGSGGAPSATTGSGPMNPGHGGQASNGGAEPSSGGNDSSTGGSQNESPGQGGQPNDPQSSYFPPGSWFYQDISDAALAQNSAVATQWLAQNGGFGNGKMRVEFSIEVLTASPSDPYLAFEPTADFYSPDCDDVPIPVPADGTLEGEAGYECTNDGDCHLIVRSDQDHRLYELWRANIVDGVFYGGCLAAWDMSRVYSAEGRGEQCTSADAAGFPIAPLLISADEVAAGEIAHAIRFILPNAKMRAKTYVHPANHAGGPSGPPEAPVYGSRWRLRADYPIESLPSQGAQAVARAMQKYGMALADGGTITLSAQSDRLTTAKWDGLLGSDDLAALQPTDFEIVETGEPRTLTYDCSRSEY